MIQTLLKWTSPTQKIYIFKKVQNRGLSKALINVDA